MGDIPPGAESGRAPSSPRFDGAVVKESRQKSGTPYECEGMTPSSPSTKDFAERPPPPNPLAYALANSLPLESDMEAPRTHLVSAVGIYHPEDRRRSSS